MMLRGQDVGGTGIVKSLKGMVEEEKKAEEMELRRAAMIKRGEKKQLSRRMHIERKDLLQTEGIERVRKDGELKLRQIERTNQLSEQLLRRKSLQLEKSAYKVRSSCDQATLVCTVLEDTIPLLSEQPQAADDWYLGDIANERQLIADKKGAYRRELQDQLIRNRSKVLVREEEKHRERKMVEQAYERMYEQDREAANRMKEAAAFLQIERDAFLKARQIFRDKRKQALEREHEDTARIIAEKQVMQQKVNEERSSDRSAHEAILEILANKLTSQEREKRDREEISRELYLAERGTELLNETKKFALKKKRITNQLFHDIANERKSIVERKAKEDAIDAAFARYLAEERKRLEEKEKQKEEARREKNIQYGRELRKTIAENRIRYESEKKHPSVHQEIALD